MLRLNGLQRSLKRLNVISQYNFLEKLKTLQIFTYDFFVEIVGCKDKKDDLSIYNTLTVIVEMLGKEAGKLLF